jgi:hypothetical protein
MSSDLAMLDADLLIVEDSRPVRVAGINLYMLGRRSPCRTGSVLPFRIFRLREMEGFVFVPVRARRLYLVKLYARVSACLIAMKCSCLHQDVGSFELLTLCPPCLSPGPTLPSGRTAFLLV